MLTNIINHCVFSPVFDCSITWTIYLGKESFVLVTTAEHMYWGIITLDRCHPNTDHHNLFSFWYYCRRCCQSFPISSCVEYISWSSTWKHRIIVLSSSRVLITSDLLSLVAGSPLSPLVNYWMSHTSHPLFSWLWMFDSISVCSETKLWQSSV